MTHGEMFSPEFRASGYSAHARCQSDSSLYEILCFLRCLTRIDKVNIKESILFCDGATPDTDVDCTFVGSAFYVCLG